LFVHIQKLETDVGTHQQESSRLRTENQTHLRDINELRDLVQVLQNDKSQVRLRQCVTWQYLTLLLLLQLEATANNDQLEIARLRAENELQRADNDDLRRDNAELRTSNQSLTIEKDQVIHDY
jgi:FtsZ-binding cell division protein ZapB